MAIVGDREGKNGVALIRNDNGKFTLQCTADLGDRPAGIVLTHDGKNLIEAMGDSVLVLDTGRLISGEPKPVVAKINDGDQAGSIYVNVTADDKILFMSNEGAATISVIDLERGAHPRIRCPGGHRKNSGRLGAHCPDVFARRTMVVYDQRRSVAQLELAGNAETRRCGA